MSSISGFGNDKADLPIGAIKVVMSNASVGIPESILIENGTWIRANAVYSKNTYPELYAQLGLIDGSIFTPRVSGTTSNLFGLVYGNGLYVAGGAGGVLRSSTDAITWDTRTSGTTSSILALAYGNGTYIFAGAGGVLGTSANGITWTLQTSGTTSQINTLVYGNGTYIYAGAGGALKSSANGVTWTSREFGVTAPFVCSAYENGRFVVAGGNFSGPLQALSSANGVTWTNLVGGQSGNHATAIGYGNNFFWIVSWNATYLARSNGTSVFERFDIDGRTRYLPYRGIWRVNTVLLYQNGTFTCLTQNAEAAIARNNFRIEDSFKLRSPGTTTINYAVYGNGVFVAVGAGGFIGTSANTDRIEYSPSYDVTTSFFVPGVTGNGTFGTVTTGTQPIQTVYVKARR